MTEQEKLIKEFGEQYRQLIEWSLDWLDEREPTWKLDKPINRQKFVKDLISHVAPETP